MVESLDETQLVSFLEAAYALELGDESWLDEMLSALSRLCGDNHHYVGFFYDASSAAEFRVWNVRMPDAPPELAEAFGVFQSISQNPVFVSRTFRSLRVGSARRTGMPYMAPVLEARARTGWGDIFNINGIDPSGIGCNVTIGARAHEFTTTSAETAIFERLANHVSAAFRARRRLGMSRFDSPVAAKPSPGTAGAEAVFDADGKLLHAEGPAVAKIAQERLRAAATAIEAARRARPRGIAALDHWHPLTGARWTLVDTFEENGRKYLVARENQAHAEGLTALTDRERQIVLHAALGFSNKQIAYALGISDTTVRVLMARAANRLGLRTRRDLLAHPALRDIHPS